MKLPFFSDLPIDNSRHFFQQPAKAFHALSYVQPFLNRPHPRGHSRFSIDHTRAGTG
jgi:hypothetical protein